MAINTLRKKRSCPRRLIGLPVHDALLKAERATPQHTLEQLTEPAGAKPGAAKGKFGAPRRFKTLKPTLTRVTGAKP